MNTKTKVNQALDKDRNLEENRFSPGNWGYFNTWVVDVGRRYRVMRESNCRLCRMLLMSRVDEANPALDGGNDFIRAVSYLMVSGLRSAWSDFWNNSYGLSKNYARVKDHVQASGCATLLRLDQPQTVPSPQKIPPAFDLDKCKDWFSYCNRNHRSLCHFTKAHVHNLRLIDCEEQCIVEYQPEMHYVALSYVWGQAESQKEAHDGKQLPSQLPSLVQDAMAVTQRIGFRYLWVDRYCIDQADPAVKHGQIQQMGSIYGNAEVTIIAAAGKDENYGLPGVGRDRPATTTVAHTSGVTVLWLAKDPQAAVTSSYWSTRGWTFQEAILSHRRLVFTDEQVYFECHAMNTFESLRIPLDKLHIKNRSKSYENLRGGVFGRNRKAEVFNQYLSNVEEYSTRKLTFPEDSLNAFQGIAQLFWYRKQAIYNIWGLPYPAPPEERARGFVHSLSWCHTTSCWDISRGPHRRPQFPSWSWAGWGGQVRYQMTSSTKKLWFNNHIRTISFENRIDSPTTLDMITPNPEEASISPILVLLAAVIPSNLIKFNSNAELDSRWHVGKHEAKLGLSCGATSESQFAEDIQDSQMWQCIYIGGILKSAFLMILKLHDVSGLWERAGIFTLDCYSHSLEPITQKCEYGTFRVI
ncbi:HET-domain-containing protein [Xylaria palmicola]|nr:HET-domain-containing protein [Xylaria palmicola]